MQPLVYTPVMQATGQFDGGKITEQKPIGFPGEGSVIKRVGPLFYWAWAAASEDAHIGLHPHQGFEIMSYVLKGEAVHGDTLGTVSTVGEGGVQVMQTGSGVSHEERLSAGSELFQIWLEPDLREAVKRVPTYRQFEHSEFAVTEGEGYRRKTVLGDGSPIELVAEANMWDLSVVPGGTYVQVVKAGYALTALAVGGQGGMWTVHDAAGRKAGFANRDFVVGQTESGTEIAISNTGKEELRLFLIEVPETVSYQLLRKR